MQLYLARWVSYRAFVGTPKHSTGTRESETPENTASCVKKERLHLLVYTLMSNLLVENGKAPRICRTFLFICSPGLAKNAVQIFVEDFLLDMPVIEDILVVKPNRDLLLGFFGGTRGVNKVANRTAIGVSHHI